MITRIIKRENPFVQIDKRVLEDPRLSWRSKGVLAYLLSKPNDWTIRSEDIIKHGTEGRDAVRAAMAELKELGYAKLVNTALGREWHILEMPEPSPENPSLGEPSPEKPHVGLANMAESATSNKEESLRDNKERDTEVAFRLEPEELKNGEKRKSDSLFTNLLPENWLRSTQIGLAWKGFVEMRKSIRKPLTDRAVTLLVGQVGRLAGANHIAYSAAYEETISAILDQSTTHNWQGVFALKQDDRHSTPAQQALKKDEVPPRYAEFIKNHPDPKFASKFALWSTSADPSLGGIRSAFNRWLRTGKYDEQ